MPLDLRVIIKDLKEEKNVFVVCSDSQMMSSALPQNIVISHCLSYKCNVLLLHVAESATPISFLLDPAEIASFNLFTAKPQYEGS